MRKKTTIATLVLLAMILLTIRLVSLLENPQWKSEVEPDEVVQWLNSFPFANFEDGEEVRQPVFTWSPKPSDLIPYKYETNFYRWFAKATNFGRLDVVLRELLITQHPDVDLAQVTFLLGYFGTTNNFHALTGALAMANGRVRTHAVAALMGIDDPRAVEPLGNAALRDSSPGVRVNACNALASIGGDQARSVLKAAADDHNGWVREAATRGLSRIEQGTDTNIK